MAAPTNYTKHIEEMQKCRNRAGASPFLAGYREGRHLPEVQFVAGRSVEGIPMRFPTAATTTRSSSCMIIGKQGSDIPKDKA